MADIPHIMFTYNNKSALPREQKRRENAPCVGRSVKLCETTRSANYDQAGILLDDVADLFASDSVALDLPEPGHIRFRGRFLCDLSECFDELRARFERHHFTPVIREEEGE